jgi:hypothetical protein
LIVTTQSPRARRVHDWLYAFDGAVVSSAVDVNPLLMIMALAERAKFLAAKQLQRKVDLNATPPRPVRGAAI